MKTTLTKCRQHLFSTMVLMCLTFSAFSQKSVSGKITGGNNESLIGVSVYEKNTTKGTTSDVDGNYKLNVSNNATLVFSFVGFSSQEVVVGNRSVINVNLQTDSRALDEIVVVGYGSVKKSDLTASVSSVKGEVIKEFPVASLDQALQGRVAGVQVSQSSAAPGGGLSVRVRGSNSILSGSEPLYVIDGLPIYPDNNAIGTGGNRQPTNALAMLNPNDIESIEVLKDASGTSIYGSRGANGVVMITTKRGKEGEGRFSYDGSYSIQNISKKIDMLRADDYMKYINILEVSQGGTGRYSASQISSAGAGTDWVNEITRQGSIQSHQLTFTGGTKAMRYAFSGNILNNEGIITNTNFKRYGFRVNLDNDILDGRATLSNSWAYSNATSNNVPTDRGGPGGIIITALGLDPTVPVYDQNGAFNYPSYDGRFSINPVAEALKGYDRDVTNRIFGTTAFTIKIIEGLKFRTSIGADIVGANRKSFYNSFTRVGRQNSRELDVFNRSVTNILNENLLTYNTTINKNHVFDITAGYTNQHEVNEYDASSTWDLPSDDVGSMNLQNGAKPQTPFSGRQEWNLESIIGRINYSAYDKYLFTATVRRDGSSKFGPNNKWATFPSAAIGWKISNEDFFKNSKLAEVVSELKLRASYGITGNSNIPPYQSVSGLVPFNYIFGGQLVAGYGSKNIPNPDLKWESTAMTNIGLNASLFNNRLGISVDWFNTKTTDLLLYVSIAQSTGYSTVLLNSGTLTNKGMDFELTYRAIDNKSLKWDIGGNISFVKNQIVDLGKSTAYYASSASGHLGVDGSWVEAGNAIGVWRGYEYAGLFTSDAEGASYSAKAGYPKYTDVNGDKKFTTDDYKIIGDPNPKFVWGLNSSLKYKNFDLAVFFRGVQGNQIRNLQQSEIGDGVQKINQISSILKDSYSADNQGATRAVIDGRRNFIDYRKSSYFIEDGSFIRLQNVALGYKVPVNSKFIRSARITVSGQNLFVITKYKGFDPEVNNSGQSNLNRGDDYDAYPRAKTFTVGVNLGF
jgi:TonB-dependent starch-binding outer membrane protein SusC